MPVRPGSYRLLTVAFFVLIVLALLLAAVMQTGCIPGCRPEEAAGPADWLALMFPDLTFTPVQGAIDTFADQNGRTFIMGTPVAGWFTAPQAPGTEELLVVVTRPRGEPAHAEGLYQAYAAVFDGTGRALRSGVQAFIADEGEWVLYTGKGRTFFFFAGSVTFQGWTDWKGGLWRAGPEWTQVWPAAADDTTDGRDPVAFWEGHLVEADEGGLNVFERRLTTTGPGQLIPSYEYVFAYRLRWDADEAAFVREP